MCTHCYFSNGTQLPDALFPPRVDSLSVKRKHQTLVWLALMPNRSLICRNQHMKHYAALLAVNACKLVLSTEAQTNKKLAIHFHLGKIGWPPFFWLHTYAYKIETEDFCRYSIVVLFETLQSHKWLPLTVCMHRPIHSDALPHSSVPDKDLMEKMIPVAHQMEIRHAKGLNNSWPQFPQILGTNSLNLIISLAFRS